MTQTDARLVAAAAPYTTSAIKGTALLEQMRALLRAWNPGEGPKEFRDRARQADILGKATASRSKDLIHLFEKRFLSEGQEHAASMRHLLDSRGTGRWFSPLCLMLAARADIVVREAVTVLLHRARSRGALSVATPDLVRFIEEQEASGRMVRPWSPTVRERVAQHVLHSLTDLGVLGIPHRGARPLLAYAPGSLAIAWLTCDLHRRGVSDASIVAHADWRVWQMEEHDVREALHRLSDIGLWVYQGAGSTVRVAWTWSAWSTVLKTLEGASLD